MYYSGFLFDSDYVNCFLSFLMISPRNCRTFVSFFESGKFIIVFIAIFWPCSYGITPRWKTFGIPLVARLSDLSYGSDIRKQFLQLLNPFLMPIEDVLNDYDDDVGNPANEDFEMEDATSSTVLDAEIGLDYGTRDETQLGADFMFYKGPGSEIKMNEPILVSGLTKELEVLVLWSDKMIEKYDTGLLSSLPEVFKPQRFMRRPQESVSLYKCLEAFLKAEPLGPEDMWLVFSHFFILALKFFCSC